MCELIVHELRTWLRLAGVREHGDRALTGARELYWLALDSGLDAYGIRMAKRRFQRIELPVADGDVWWRLGNHVDGLPQPASTYEFLRKVADIAPPWISKGPLASAGKFELFYRMTRPGCGWPKSGDVLDRNRVIEIKGQNGQLIHPTITGLSHHTASLDAFSPYGFTPNSIKYRDGSVRASFEVIKPSVQEFYSKQFMERYLAANESLAQYLTFMGLCDNCCSLDRAHDMLQSSDGFGDPLRKAWLDAIYDENKRSKRAFDRLIVFGDGTNVKVIDDKDDLSKLNITGVGLRSGRPDRLSLCIN